MNIVLFINGPLGIRVLDYISEIKGCRIIQIFLNSEEKQSKDYTLEVQGLLEKKKLEVPISPWTGNSAQIEDFCTIECDNLVGVSALFGHVLPQEMISRVSGGILNLHPSFLPIGRGAHPITWNMVEEKIQGVTIHLIDQHLDTGNVIFQQEIPTSLDMSAGDVYAIAMNELLKHFSEVFEKWLTGNYPSFPQAKIEATEHKSSDLYKLSTIQEDEVATFGEFVRRIQATTFSDGRFPLLKDNYNNLWRIELRLTNFVEQEGITSAR